MRRLVLLGAAAASLAACFAPLPCTQALCPSKVEGRYTVAGWNRSVTVDADSPQVPVVSDSEVAVVGGRVQFVNRRTTVSASEGAAFRFVVSTDSARTPLLTVSSGTVVVAVSSSAPVALAPGTSFALPIRD